MNTVHTDPLAVETIELLRTLVAIDPVNPSLDPLEAHISTPSGA